jgi:DNA-directed RNA polymerase I, II, and III subunit RPABC5
MIVPIKCFGCGKELANLYRVYLEKVREKKLSKNQDPARIVYLTTEPMEVSPEKEVMDALRLNKICCRNIMLTVVEL